MFIGDYEILRFSQVFLVLFFFKYELTAKRYLFMKELRPFFLLFTPKRTISRETYTRYMSLRVLADGRLWGKVPKPTYATRCLRLIHRPERDRIAAEAPGARRNPLQGGTPPRSVQRRRCTPLESHRGRHYRRG